MPTHLFLPLMATRTSLSACTYTHILAILYILLPVCRVIRSGRIQWRAPALRKYEFVIKFTAGRYHRSILTCFRRRPAVAGNAYSFHSFEESGGGSARAFSFISFAHLLVVTASWSGLVSRSSRARTLSVRKHAIRYVKAC